MAVQTRALSPTPASPLSNRNSVFSIASAVSSDDGTSPVVGLLTQDDLRTYLNHLPQRTPTKIPPVVAGGLPSLEAMKIPHYDPVRLKFNPNADQKRTIRVQARRGPRYMLSFLSKKMGYKLPPRGGGGGAAEDPEAWSAVITTDSRLESVWSVVGASTSSLESPPPYGRKLPLAPTPPQQQVREGVVSKLKKKVSFGGSISMSGLRKLPTPEHSEEELSSMSSGASSFIAPVNANAPITPILETGPPGDTAAPPQIVSAFTKTKNTKRRKTPSILGFVSASHASTTPAGAHTINLPCNGGRSGTGIRRSHKYLANMGVLQFPGSITKHDFEVIVDPKFPRSIIDISALVREAGHERGKDYSALLSNPFHVIATPVYDPECEFNRVSIQFMLVPADHQSSAASPKTAVPAPALAPAPRVRSVHLHTAYPAPPAIKELDTDPLVSYRKSYLNASVTYKEMMMNSCAPTPGTAKPHIPAAPRSMRQPLDWSAAAAAVPPLPTIPLPSPPSPTETLTPGPRKAAVPKPPPVPPKAVAPPPAVPSHFSGRRKKPQTSSRIAQAKAAAITGYTPQNAGIASTFTVFGFAHSSSSSSSKPAARAVPAPAPAPPLPATPDEVERQLEAEREQELQNNLFAKQWQDASRDVVVVSHLGPINCVLGRDWLEMLHREAYQEDEDPLDDDNLDEDYEF